MQLTFATEDWSDCVGEMQLLWQDHWNEVATHKDKVALAPNLIEYERANASGQLHLTTARLRGELVGYLSAIVRPHLHYKHSLSAFYDLYYLAPPHRRGANGLHLFREAERALKARGVERLFTGTKLSKDASVIFERQGWLEAERLFVKWIGD